MAEQFTRHVFPKLGNLPIASIRKPDVFVILDGLVASSRLRTANVIFADLKQLFRFAAERKFIEASLIESIEKERVGGSDTARERNLADAEISALPALLGSAKLAKRTELGLWVIVATGARVGELMGAAWSTHKTSAKKLAAAGERCAVKYGTVNLMTRTWHIVDTKNQRDHTIHPSDFAVDQLKQLVTLQ